MLSNYHLLFLLILFKLITAKYYHPSIKNSDTITSISSFLGARLLFNLDVINEFIKNDHSKTITWYKGIGDLKQSIANLVPFINPYKLSRDVPTLISPRYFLIDQTKLLIEQTLIGDEGFYTLEIRINSNISKYYLYHVILLTQNLSLSLFPSSPYRHFIYHAEQQINFTCSISFVADHSYIEQFRSTLLSTWYMIVYNNDPDHYQLLPLSSNSYRYTASLLNYELNRNDHNQHVSCTLFQQELQSTNVTLSKDLNIEYKAYLRGNYYFIRSFNSYSSIEINCEEFDANPKAIYTLIWVLNGQNQTLLNQTIYGRYLIKNATWHHRGNYMCLAENYLNHHQPVYQSFRLNIWFNEHQLKVHPLTNMLILQQLSSDDSNKSIILIILSTIFVVTCLCFVLSFYYFCSQLK
ncbi:hypothetical protein I4U23_020532 [Adineta vaga]|nr:hypothetical protein I4U23_020532 [Adineta vaga]